MILLFPVAVHALPGDVDGSGRVDGYDLIALSVAYGSSIGDANWNPDADLDGTGAVDAADLNILSIHFGNKGISFGLWVGDQLYGTQNVSKLSSKGNLLRRVGDFSHPISISSNLTDGSVWVADSYAGKVKKLDPFTGATLLAISGMNPYSVSVNSRDGSVWVADFSGNRVVKLLPSVTDGYTIDTNTGSHIAVTGFNGPASVSVNPETGVLWVADLYGGRVVRLSSDITDGYNISTDSGKHVIKSGFSYPYAIAADVRDGSAWVVDYYNNQVVKLAATGTAELFRLSGFSYPYAVAVNYIDGSVWVADRGNNRIVRVAADGSILASAGGFNYPNSVAVNPLDGTAWVADYNHNQVVKLSPKGAELMRISGFYAPISLTVTPDEVSASKAPVATSSLSSNLADVSQSITFTGTGSDPDGQIALYEWDFDGNGTFDYQSTTTGVTTHAYSSAGIYNPVFRVTDNDFLTATDSSQVVRVGTLQAIAGADVTTGSAPLTVNFTASFLDPIDGRISRYQWDFDGDGTFEYDSTSTGNTSRTYDQAGTYTAVLKIIDGAYVATDTIVINISSSSPTAQVSASPLAGVTPLTVNFTGSGDDPDGTVVLFQWDFDGDGIYEWNSISGGDAPHTYVTAGRYTAKFRVIDNDGLIGTAEVTVEVGKVPPVAVANASPTEGYPPLTVNFNATGSHDPDGGSIVQYEWNFASECAETVKFTDDMEGSTTTWTAAPPWERVTTTSHSPTTSWTDSPAGNYANSTNVSLTSAVLDLSDIASATLTFWHRYTTESGYDYGRVEISTNGGNTWSQLTAYSGSQTVWTQVQLDISSYLPSAFVKIRFRLTSDYSVTYDGWYIDDVSISICQFSWTASADGTAQYTYSSAGTYTATLRVTDNDGNQGTDTVDIAVTPLTQPTATAAADTVTGISPLTVNFTGSGVDPNGNIVEYRWNFGEEQVWVADSSHSEVVRLYPDGSGEILRKGGFNYIYSVSVDPGSGAVWVADYYNGRVVKLSSNGAELVRVGSIYYPRAVSVNPADGSVWVAENYYHQVIKLSSNGTELVRVGGFYYPYSVSVNPTDGSVWVADYYNSQVVKLDSNGSQLVRVSGFYYPQSVSVNSTDGSVWVADTSNSKVVKLDSNGTELVRVGGFSYPQSVSVNSADGSAWVPDYYHNQVVKLDANGNELARLSGFSYPVAVGVAGGGPDNYYNSSTTGDTSHTYSAPGTYIATLTVIDNDGNKDVERLTIRVYGVPTVTAGANITAGKAPLEVFLFGTAIDLDGFIVKYEWDFDGNGVYDYQSPSTPNTRFTYASAGAYNARLRATDNDGYSATATVTITVSQSPPIVSANAVPLQGNAPLEVSFSGSGSDPDGSIVSYEWDLDNDGIYDFTSSTTGSTTQTYNTSGTYTATLRVTDNDGLTATASLIINVYATGAPSALIYATPTSGFSPLEVRFCGSGIDRDGTIASYEWDLDGDGTFEISSTTSPTAFGDKMEDGTGQWTATPPWSLTSATYQSRSFSWTDSPDGNYADNIDVSLTSRTIDLSGAIAPRLIFWHRYDFQYSDYGYVEVSGNNGASWSQVTYFSGSKLDKWTKQEYDLRAYAGNSTVKVRFRVLTYDYYGTADGWYVDDVWVGDCFRYTYQTEGIYTPVLRVTDNNGKQATASENISVTQKLNASFVWVADYYNSQVVKLSDDGRALARISGFYYPREVEVDERNGDVWVSDTSNDRVIKLSAGVPNGYSVSGQKITDDSSYNNTAGLLYGDAVLTTGNLNGGISLDGNGDYIQMADSPSYRMDSWTMEAWIKPNSFSGTKVIAGKVSQGKDFALVLFDDKIGVLVYDNGRRYLTTSTATTPGQWYHVAGVYDASAVKLRLYVDGVFAGEAAYRPDTSNTDPMRIGSSYCCGEYFDGVIDDVRIWNVARTETEIAGNKNVELTGSETGLVGYWKLNSTPASPYHLIATGFDDPWGLSVDTSDGSVWVADYYHSQVVKLDANGNELARVSGFSYPSSVSVDSRDSSVWVADYYGSRVVKLASDGSQLLTVSGFYYPRSVEVDPTDGSVWVTDSSNNKMVKLASDGTVLYRRGGFSYPVDVAVNRNDGTVWVADQYNGQVVKLASNSAEIARVSGFNNPDGLDVNPKDGTVWVADYYNSHIVKLSPNGTELLRVPGFSYPSSVSVDGASRNVNQPPSATASASPNSGDAPLTVTFTGSATDNGSIVRYEWDFDGDGIYEYISSTTGNTTYTYNVPGTYNSVFRVTDNDGMMAYAASNTIYVGALSVFASASPSSGNAPLYVTLDGYVRGLGPARYITKYEWDFEGDGIFDYSSTDSPKTTRTYSVGRVYTPVLRVTDSSGNQAYGKTTLTVNKVAPTAYAYYTNPTSGPLPLTVNLTASAYDADGSIVLYEWDYNGDGTYDWFSHTTGNTYFVYTTAGTYNPTMRATDNDGLTATASVTITVSDRQDPPIAIASAAPIEGSTPLTVNFTGTGNDPDDGSITKYEWDFEGDGTYDYSSTSTGNTSHTYDTAGQYTARLRVTDADSLTGTASVLVNVKPAGYPTAVANADPVVGPTPLTVNFSATGSTDPDGNIVLYEWTFGDEVVWVADYYNQNVVRLQGQQIDKRLTGFSYPYRLSVYQADGSVWVSDHSHGQVVKLKGDGSTELARVGGFNGPYGLSVNQADGSVWVADYYNHQVVKLSPQGTELARVSGFYYPTSVAVNKNDGSVWVADYYNSRVVKLSSNGALLATIYGFYNPFWVSVDQRDGSVWVADRYNNRVVKLAPDTQNGYNLSSSTVTPDATSNNVGTVAGDATGATGNLSGGLAFDGYYDYVEIPDSQVFRMNSWTIEAWIKPASFGGTRLIAGKVSQAKDFALMLNGDKISILVYDGGRRYLDSPTPATAGQWYHAAAVYDTTDGKLKLYVNGVFVGGVTYIPDTSNTDPFRIGASYCCGESFSGVIDDVRVWNVARTETEIAGNKDAELTGSETGLVGYWKLNSVLTSPYHKSISGFNQPLCVAVDQRDGSAWACDYYNNQMVKISSDVSHEIARVGGFYNPHEAFVNPLDGSVWVADQSHNEIAKLSADGREIWRIGGFNNPTSVVAYSSSSSMYSSATDGTTSHIYNRDGAYLATLRVTDNDGNTDSDSVTIKAGIFPESLPIAYPTSGPAPLTVRFAANGRSPAGTIEYFYWDFNGDGSIDWSTPISETYSYTYNAPGTYRATQRVVDNRGLSDSKSILITVTLPATNPTAQAIADPVEGNSPLEVNFIGLGLDVDGFITKFEWDLDNDGVFDFSSTANGVTTHTYTAQGIYTAVLRVTDNDGNTGTDSVRIEVKPAGAPVANANATPASGVAALNVTFTGTGTDDGRIVNYEWDFDGNGTYDWTSATTGSASYSYTREGSYNATLRVTDDSGLTDTASVNILVSVGISATLSTDMFDPAGGQTVGINSTITVPVDKFTIKIKDRVGNVVRTLVNNAPRAAGYYSDAWDGKDDSGRIVNSGVYLYMIEYEVGGKRFVYDVTNTVDNYAYTPSVTYPPDFNPFNAETNFFRYILDTKSEVTVYISYWALGDYWGVGPRVRTLLLRKPQKAGSYVLVWDGTDDSGDLVQPHTYVIAVFAWRLPSNAIIVVKEPVISDLLVTPAYLNPDARPYDEAYQAKFTYTLSKMADVKATVYDPENFAVRTLSVSNVPAGGGNTITWDGRNQDGKYVAPGTYRLKLTATDASGVQSSDANALLVIFY